MTVAKSEIEGVESLDAEYRLAEVAGHLNVQHARLVEVVADAQRDGSWQGHRIHTPAQWLTIHVGVSSAQARKVMTIAARVGEFPQLMSVFRRGGLSLDQVHEVAARAPGWADRQMTEFAQIATVSQLRRMIRDEHFDHDPDDPPPAPPSPSPGVSVSWDEHSRVQIHGSLDTDEGLLVEAAGNEIRDALFSAGERDISWGDVLTEMARRSLACTTLERSRRFMPSVHLHCDTGAIQLTNGVSLSPTLRDYLLCDNTIRPVWERDRIPFGVGRSQRNVPDRTRRVIEHRDQGCRVPGCGSRHVDIHHIVEWAHGGETETFNLVSLCRRHHRLLHHGELHISGNADTPNGLTISDRHQRTLVDHPSPVLPDEPPPTPQRYEHPSGDRLQPKWTARMGTPQRARRPAQATRPAPPSDPADVNARHRFR